MEPMSNPVSPILTPGAGGDIKSCTREALQAWLVETGAPAYRASQVLHWLYRQRATAWSEMTNLPQSLRDQLSQAFSLHPITLVTHQGAVDQTQKFLWRLRDGSLIESVLLAASPALYGDPSDRRTLCVSTQVGCAYGCRYCASGLDGWKRDLEPYEIVEQVLAPERRHAHVDNLVVMGMGEPLANYDNLIQALRILNAPWGGKIGARKITISTSGLAPRIRQLAREPFQFRLAISLHAASDQIRDRLMPMNRKYPLAQLVAACEEYLAETGRQISFEYILIAGVNDGLDQVKPLALLARRLHARINLIPYNTVEGLPWQRPSDSAQDAFLESLRAFHLPVTLRREKGGDIDAACGQLRLKTERALHPSSD
jgi:23S rRNA (adenine2503-C2)-methyltransferase